MARRVIWGVAAMLGLTVAGVVGFMVVAGAEPLDALYMTVVTISTVGYNEIVPLDQGGRIFAIVLIIAGLAATGYTGAVTVEDLVSGHLLARVAQRRREQALTALRDHFIVCGFGRVGEGIIENLRTAGRSVVTIDHDPGRCERAEGQCVLTVCRNAASAETLRAAGINRAAAVLVSTGDDADNVYTVLSARATAPGIPVIARANTNETVERLMVAGATRVFSPHAAGAQHMASYVLKPNVAWALSELLDAKSKDMTIEEVAIASRSSYVGRNIGAVGLRQHGVEVMAIGRNGEQHCLPPRDETLCAGDVLVMTGPPPNVRRFTEQAGE
ncbi:MAG: potassium channel protein [Chloroflexota bacterium]|nr:potassium channel protein [Chloroflexota bacterium]